MPKTQTFKVPKGTQASLTADRFRNGAEELLLNVQIEEGAVLDYFQLEEVAANQTRTSKTVFELGPNAVLRAVLAVSGQGTCRTETNLHLKGALASAEISALSLLNGDARVSHQATAFHEAPSCQSHQFYKNVMAGSSQVECESLVSVSRGASKTDSEQLIKSLLLSDNARVQTRPWLRIDTDDVSCKHGAAVGQIQGDEVFYLRSRGIPEKLARFMLIYGFAEEVVDKLKDPVFHKNLKTITHRELDRMIGEGK